MGVEWFYNITTGACQAEGIRQLTDGETSLFEKRSSSTTQPTVDAAAAAVLVDDGANDTTNTTTTTTTPLQGINESIFINFCTDAIYDMLKTKDEIVKES